MAMIHIALAQRDGAPASVLASVPCPALRDDQMTTVVDAIRDSISGAIQRAVTKETAHLAGGGFTR